MKTDLISSRVDHETKVLFTRICEEIGVSPSQAIKLFARAVINSGGIPFELKGKQPNKLTLLAMEELEANQGHRVSSVKELFEELEAE
jgi:DNA-damage-inducible protein J